MSRYMTEYTSDAKDSLFISPPEMPLTFPGVPMKVSAHFVSPNYKNTTYCQKKYIEAYKFNKFAILYYFVQLCLFYKPFKKVLMTHVKYFLKLILNLSLKLIGSCANITRI